MGIISIIGCIVLLVCLFKYIFREEIKKSKNIEPKKGNTMPTNEEDYSEKMKINERILPLLKENEEKLNHVNACDPKIYCDMCTIYLLGCKHSLIHQTKTYDKWLCGNCHRRFYSDLYLTRDSKRVKNPQFDDSEEWRELEFKKWWDYKKSKL